MQSLLIEHASRKRLYNQGFVDNVVMALCKDGTNELFLLANQQALPDLDAVKYLERKAEAGLIEIMRHSNLDGLVAVKLVNPQRTIYVATSDIGDAIKFGRKIFVDATLEPLRDGEYHTENGHYFEVKNGRISKTKLNLSLPYFMIIVTISVIVSFFIFIIVRII